MAQWGRMLAEKASGPEIEPPVTMSKAGPSPMHAYVISAEAGVGGGGEKEPIVAR